jgi:hypothetical protein
VFESFLHTHFSDNYAAMIAAVSHGVDASAQAYLAQAVAKAGEEAGIDGPAGTSAAVGLRRLLQATGSASNGAHADADADVDLSAWSLLPTAPRIGPKPKPYSADDAAALQSLLPLLQQTSSVSDSASASSPSLQLHDSTMQANADSDSDTIVAALTALATAPIPSLARSKPKQPASAPAIPVQVIVKAPTPETWVPAEHPCAQGRAVPIVQMPMPASASASASAGANAEASSLQDLLSSLTGPPAEVLSVHSLLHPSTDAHDRAAQTVANSPEDSLFNIGNLGVSEPILATVEGISVGWVQKTTGGLVAMAPEQWKIVKMQPGHAAGELMSSLQDMETR